MLTFPLLFYSVKYSRELWFISYDVIATVPLIGVIFFGYFDDA